MSVLGVAIRHSFPREEHTKEGVPRNAKEFRIIKRKAIKLD